LIWSFKGLERLHVSDHPQVGTIVEETDTNRFLDEPQVGLKPWRRPDTRGLVFVELNNWGSAKVGAMSRASNEEPMSEARYQIPTQLPAIC